MNNRYKVLVIENQKSQFDKIESYLSSCEVYPKDYTKAMEPIRIFLSPKRYADERLTSAFDRFHAQVKGQGIQLIIMDYKLSGSFDGKNGIYLAKKLKTLPEFADTPIIFLSRTPFNEKEIMDSHHDIPNSVWIEKSYFGSDNLESDYFEKHVIGRFDQLIPLTEFQILSQSILDQVNKKPFNLYGSELVKLVKKATEEGGFSPEQKMLLNQLYPTNHVGKTVHEIHKILKELIKN